MLTFTLEAAISDPPGKSTQHQGEASIVDHMLVALDVITPGNSSLHVVAESDAPCIGMCECHAPAARNKDVPMCSSQTAMPQAPRRMPVLS